MLANRVEQTSTTTGTGTYSLTGTVADRVTFVTGIGTAKQCYYLAVDNTNGGWEIGIGTVTDLATDTLSRDTIIGSSNGGLAVNWAAGTRNLMVVAAAELFGPMGGRLIKGAVGGTANAITVTSPVPLRALTDGAVVLFDPTANSNAAITLNVDSLGAIALKDSLGGAFSAVSILRAGQTCLVSYKASTGFWHVISALGPPVGVDVQSFTSSGTWTKPTGIPKRVRVQLWGGGGSGARGVAAGGTGGGGGGGGYVEGWFDPAALGATETVTVGAGGAAVGADSTDGNAGNTSIFGGGSLLTAGGGGGGGFIAAAGGGGGGGGGIGPAAAGAGTSATTGAGGAGGGPSGGAAGAAGNPGTAGSDSSFGGGGGGGGANAAAGAGGVGGNSAYGGGGGGGGGGPSNGAGNGGQGGLSYYGGGGGGGSSGAGVAGSNGSSILGGSGGTGAKDGAPGNSGSQPGGGGGGNEGGANSGAGGDGMCVVTTFF